MSIYTLIDGTSRRKSQREEKELDRTDSSGMERPHGHCESLVRGTR